jgi:hypothetical protein
MAPRAHELRFMGCSTSFQTAGARLDSSLQEVPMSSIVKVIEVVAQSDKGFDDAVRNAVQEASKTISGIRSVWVENLSVKVENDRIINFRANCKISFVLKGHP